jgi:hypothetical protein
MVLKEEPVARSLEKACFDQTQIFVYFAVPFRYLQPTPLYRAFASL